MLYCILQSVGQCFHTTTTTGVTVKLVRAVFGPGGPNLLVDTSADRPFLLADLVLPPLIWSA